MEIVRVALLGLGGYLAIGALFAIPFAFGLVGRVSPSARGVGWGFRLLIVPGSAVFWPLLVWSLIPGRATGSAELDSMNELDPVRSDGEFGS